MLFRHKLIWRSKLILLKLEYSLVSTLLPFLQYEPWVPPDQHTLVQPAQVEPRAGLLPETWLERPCSTFEDSCRNPQILALYEVVDLHNSWLSKESMTSPVTIVLSDASYGIQWTWYRSFHSSILIYSLIWDTYQIPTWFWPCFRPLKCISNF